MKRDDSMVAGVLAALVVVALLLVFAGAGAFWFVGRRTESARLVEVQARVEAEAAVERERELRESLEQAPPLTVRAPAGRRYQVEVTPEELAVWDLDGSWLHLEKGSGGASSCLVVGIVGKPPTLGLEQLEIDLGSGEVLRLPRRDDALLRVVGQGGVVAVPGAAPPQDVLVRLLDAGTSIEHWLLEWTEAESVDRLFEPDSTSR